MTNAGIGFDNKIMNLILSHLLLLNIYQICVFKFRIYDC